MWKILEYLNIVKNIKKYISIKKLEKYSKEKKSVGVSIVNILIAIVVIIILSYIAFINKNYDFKVTTIVLTALFIIFYLIKISVFVMSNEKECNAITKIMIIGGQENHNKEWELTGKKSLLIGKQTRNNEVDIDLSNTEHASLISKQHAVLNFAANNCWYIEDIESCNGVGIKKVNETSKKKMQRDTPYKLDVGDIIYIANTKLFVQ